MRSKKFLAAGRTSLLFFAILSPINWIAYTGGAPVADVLWRLVLPATAFASVVVFLWRMRIARQMTFVTWVWSFRFTIILASFLIVENLILLRLEQAFSPPLIATTIAAAALCALPLTRSCLGNPKRLRVVARTAISPGSKIPGQRLKLRHIAIMTILTPPFLYAYDGLNTEIHLPPWFTLACASLLATVGLFQYANEQRRDRQRRS
jgi:hypothetical protein